VSSLHGITQSNRDSWNQIHSARLGQPPSFFASGGSALEDFEVELAGDVTGKRVLQLACSCGDEALSWASLGADVTGIDISEVAIDLARDKSVGAGIAVDFRQADIFDLPADLTGFDLIYCSWGAICWVPDLAVFAAILADRLRSGGSVLLAEHHPVWEILAVRGSDHLAVRGNYFSRTAPRTEIDNAKLPTGARDTPNAPEFSSFVWPTSDVVMSFLTAGLSLDAFIEAPDPNLFPNLTSAAHLPATYVIKATKPEADVSHETSTASP
jgi:2-polyprenyl-3-methyl-5-hydroxy-6-metoxy-1,4-benzoquinol methylase